MPQASLNADAVRQYIIQKAHNTPASEPERITDAVDDEGYILNSHKPDEVPVMGAKVENGMLYVKLPVFAVTDAPLSNTGKTKLVANSGGPRLCALPDLDGLRIGVTAMVPVKK